MQRIAALACSYFVLAGFWAFAQAPPRNPVMTRDRVAERVRTFDANKDGQVTREEFRGPAVIFSEIDKNADGVMSAEELAEFGKSDQPFQLRPGAPARGERKKETPAARKPVGGIPAEVKALSAMTAGERYKGEDGGLYGKGKNTPPAKHLEAALNAARAMQPLDKQGKPARDGKVVFISFGMSNTTQEFQAFLKLIKPLKLPPWLVVIDGAQGGMEARAWGTGIGINGQPVGQTPWEVLAQRLEQAGVTPRQVQAAWVKLAVGNPAADGEYPAHVKKFEEYSVAALQKLQAACPNLRLAYFSNRIYAGYATTTLNPEPYAYEYAYGIRHIILDQIAGKPELNHDPAQGAVKMPLVLWGPDLWANGERARQDGLQWSRADLAYDGTHPSDGGRAKVAKLLLDFLRADPTAQIWFGGPAK